MAKGPAASIRGASCYEIPLLTSARGSILYLTHSRSGDVGLNTMLFHKRGFQLNGLRHWFGVSYNEERGVESELGKVPGILNTDVSANLSF